MHATRVRRGEQVLEVFIGAVAFGDTRVIADVITGVAERRGEAGIDPQRVATQFLYIVEVFGDALDVADAVIVGIGETCGEHLIECRVGKPRRGGVLRLIHESLLNGANVFHLSKSDTHMVDNFDNVCRCGIQYRPLKRCADW